MDMVERFSDAPALIWFREDLRLADNPALCEATRRGRPVLPVYILDDEAAGPWAMGGASRWWLHQSLKSLDRALGGTLVCVSGSAERWIPQLARDIGAASVHINRCVAPWQIDADERVEAALARDGISLDRHCGSSLYDPLKVLKPDGTPYRVFTPFYRRGCLGHEQQPRAPLPAPDAIHTVDCQAGDGIDALGLMPDIDWYSGLEETWSVGEDHAHERLDDFLEKGLAGYESGRNRPDLEQVSRLSPHLRFGEISPNQVWHSVLPLKADPKLSADVDSFCSELGWREFSRYLLTHWPTLPDRNWQPKFDRFPWRSDDASLQRWQQGRTGYAIVDAGMRELWQTGYMHNRVRMIVGSFLVKNLMLDWRQGERWFWDTLVDADLANNSASWQWVAGSGADAAPFFRIFNPVTQARKFDPDGDYIRRFVPELAGVGPGEIHEPRPPSEPNDDGGGYPAPIVELPASRERALAAFKALAGG
jgi:deoxyribodipyrimidine photo-lyase